MTKIEQRWNDLQPYEEKPIFQLVDASHPLKFYVGKELSGELLFLLVAPDQPSLIRNFRSISIHSFKRSDGDWSLLFRLERSELTSIFALLCEDMMGCTRGIKNNISPMKFVGNRLKNWRRLLEDANLRLLSLDEIRGLFGELFVFQKYFLPELGPAMSINAWGGPHGADQDFQFSDSVCEVKTVYPGGMAITISSEKQLFSTLPKFSLHVLTLENNEEQGISLNSMIELVRSDLFSHTESLEKFDALLAQMNYIRREEYDSPHLRITYENTYEVIDGFPRLTPASLPLGISKIRYSINLAHCEHFKVKNIFIDDNDGN